jgi:hypothetical protein
VLVNGGRQDKGAGCHELFAQLPNHGTPARRGR